LTVVQTKRAMHELPHKTISSELYMFVVYICIIFLAQCSILNWRFCQLLSTLWILNFIPWHITFC